jgi:hypothetical protein
VLVSLNGPVDYDVPSMWPQVHKDSNIPYMFIDGARHHEDSATLFQTAVRVMLFMIQHVEDNKDPEALGQKVRTALCRANAIWVSIFETIFTRTRPSNP